MNNPYGHYRRHNTTTGDWAAPVDPPASETWGERRLLDPPTPSRPEWADLADVIRETTYHPEPDDLARALHLEGVRVVTEEEER